MPTNKTKSKEKRSQFPKFRLLEIKLLDFSFKPSVHIEDDEYDEVEFRASSNIKFIVENKVALVRMGVIGFEPEQKEDLFSMNVGFGFEIENMHDFIDIKANSIELPEEIYINFLSIAYSAMRGMFHVVAAPTIFNEVILPLASARIFLSGTYIDKIPYPDRQSARITDQE